MAAKTDVVKYLLTKPDAVEQITDYRAALLRRKNNEISDLDFHLASERYLRWHKKDLNKLFPEVRKMFGCKQPGVLLRRAAFRLVWVVPVEQDIVLASDTTPDSDEE